MEYNINHVKNRELNIADLEIFCINLYEKCEQLTAQNKQLLEALEEICKWEEYDFERYIYMIKKVIKPLLDSITGKKEEEV